MHEVEQGFSQGLDTEETAALVKSLVAADDAILAEVYMEAILHAYHDTGGDGQRNGPCVPQARVKKEIVVSMWLMWQLWADNNTGTCIESFLCNK